MSLKKENSLSKEISFQFQALKKFPLLPYLVKWILICTILGILIGSASAGFLQSLAWVTTYRENHLWIIYFLPIAGLLIGLLYHYYGKEVASGNQLLFDTIDKPKQIVPFKMAPFVYVGTMATHLFGGSAGREGTALQMAGAIADQLTNPFKLAVHERKILIIAAIAAGFGSVFGTPLAGTIFALEVFLIGRITYDSILPAFLAAIIADLVTKLWQVHHTQYHIGFIPNYAFLNLVYVMLGGIIFGLCAIVFSKALHYGTKVFKLAITYPPLRPFVGGILVIAAIWLLGSTKYIGLGIPTITAAFDQQLPMYDFALKMAFTILTLSAGFKGGEVTPLFFIGAALGSALSVFIPLPVALLAGTGFVAVFAGATNAPIACTMMAMELFGSSCGVYVAIACLVAYFISGNNSIYDKRKVGGPKYKRLTNYVGKYLKAL